MKIANRCLPHRTWSASAFTLLECITYMGVLLVIMLLAFEAYERAATSSGSLQRSSADIVKVLQCGERWREDIRQATREPRLIISDQSQTIRIPQKAGEVIYIFKQNAVQRSTDGKTWKQFLPNVRNSAMQKDKRAIVEAWRWELELKSASTAKKKRLFTFFAVPSTSIK